VGEPIVIPPAGGEIIGDSRLRRVEILSDHESLHATGSRFGPHREGADLHVHREHTDLFYVLDGELTLRLGVEDEQVVAQPGTLVRVPPNVVHGFRNGGDVDVRYLNFHAPGQRFADYLRAMRDKREFSYDQFEPPADGGRPTSDAAIGEELFVADRPGLQVALLADVEAIGITVATSETGSPSPPPHYHPVHTESFYVLAGEMAFTAGEREYHAQAGTWVQVPPGVPHSFSFPGTEETRFLDVHTPNCGFGAFVRELHEARTDADLVAARERFDQIAV